MENALEILCSIEAISQKLLDIIKKDNLELLPEILENRRILITSLERAKSTNPESEKNALRRIEKIESKMFELLKDHTTEIKESINTVSKGKKAVKNGYFKSKVDYEKNNRFSKRG